MTKVAFCFSTYERANYSKRSLKSVDDGDFDLIWVDGSDSEEARALPDQVQFNKCRLLEVHRDIKGSREGGWHPADTAIRFSLNRCLDLDYDYIGLIENDIEFKPGWFNKIMETIDIAMKDGFNVGSVTVRNFQDRVLEYRDGYTLNWNQGAGMVLFTNRGAQDILTDYRMPSCSDIQNFYQEFAGIDVHLHGYGFVGADWNFARSLYKMDQVSIGSIPSMAYNFDCNIGPYVEKTHLPCPIMEANKLPCSFIQNKIGKK